jgi:hypothetical protein
VTVSIGDLNVVLATVAAPDGAVVLRIAAVAPASPTAGPDEIVLSIVLPAGPQELARLDGRYLSTEVAAGFTGRMLALGALTAPAHFLSLAYHPDV